MDSKKTIKRYILRKPWMKAVGIILCVAAVVLAAMGFAALGAADNDAAEFYPGETPAGTMAYVDVIGVSDWLYQYDDAVYYTVLDAEGYLYTVRLSDSGFDDLKAQNDYWHDDSASAPVPEAVRLTGYVQNVTSDVRSNLAEVWGITTAEYDQYFGGRFLNTTTSTGEQASMPWFMGALFAILFGLFCLMMTGRSEKIAKKCLARLEELNLLERAARQVENVEVNTIIGKSKGMLSQEFLFGKGTGVVVPYTEILWCYQQDRKRNFVPVNSYLMVATSYMDAQCAVDLDRYDRKGVISGAIEEIAQRNHNVLIGYSRENGQAYRSMVSSK